jgi:prolyl-tRNA synthetase
VGALVMAHGDDEGLILPPRIAPIQVVIIPIYKGDERKDMLDQKGKEIASELKKTGIRVKFDNNDNNRPGWKFAEYEKKGVPVRIALGLRDLDNKTIEVARRDTKEKISFPDVNLVQRIERLLAEIQENMYNKALQYRDEHITNANSWDEFVQLLDEKGGFISAHWDGNPETEEIIKEKTKATIRCIPLNNPSENGFCIYSGKPSMERVLFARAY